MKQRSVAVILMELHDEWQEMYEAAQLREIDGLVMLTHCTSNECMERVDALWEAVLCWSAFGDK